MSGTKTVEFRKRPFGRHVTHVVVYASSPVKQVLGYFEVSGVDQASPSELWRRYSEVGGIERPAYDEYFGAATEAVAIQVSRVHAFAKPMPLTGIFPSGRPPQSYAYLPRETLGRLSRRKRLP